MADIKKDLESKHEEALRKAKEEAKNTQQQGIA